MSHRGLWRRPDVLAYAAAASIALLLVYYLLLTRVTTFERLAEAAAQVPAYLPIQLSLVLVTTVLFGTNFAIVVLLTRARRGSSTQAGSIVGGFVGAFGAGCPACGAYLFSLVGVSGGLALLPFGGLELWALSSLLMAVTLTSSLRRLDEACAADEADCPMLPDPSRRQTVIAAGTAVTLSLALIGAVALYG
jgi:hypothetical protein